MVLLLMNWIQCRPGMSSSIDTAMASWFLRLLITKRYVSSSLCFVLVPDDSFDALVWRMLI